MRRVVSAALGLAALASVATAQTQVPPPWAYTVNPPPASGAKPAPAAGDPAPRTVPGSRVSLTVAQTRDAFNPPDWFPDAHPPMPPSVAHGRKPELRACGFCHLVNGQGRPENASLAGLPAAYKPAGLTARQLADTLRATAIGLKHTAASRAAFVDAFTVAVRAICLPLG